MVYSLIVIIGEGLRGLGPWAGMRSYITHDGVKGCGTNVPFVNTLLALATHCLSWLSTY